MRRPLCEVRQAPLVLDVRRPDGDDGVSTVDTLLLALLVLAVLA